MDIPVFQTYIELEIGNSSKYDQRVQKKKNSILELFFKNDIYLVH